MFSKIFSLYIFFWILVYHWLLFLMSCIEKPFFKKKTFENHSRSVSLQKQPFTDIRQYGFLKNHANLQENIYGGVYFSCDPPISSHNFTKKETAPQVFSSKVCKVFKNVFFIEHLQRGSVCNQHNKVRFLIFYTFFTNWITFLQPWQIWYRWKATAERTITRYFFL